MSLTFYTKPQQMTFVHNGSQIDAWKLSPQTDYTVFFVIQNSSKIEADNIQVQITHSPFGIGLPGSTTNLVQPLLVNVPPNGPGGNGLATVTFHYTTPAGGHACLCATIQPNGETLCQNTDVIGVPPGITSSLSFLVFGGTMPEVMNLKLTEYDNGTPGTWNPLMVAPSGIGSPASAPSSINLNLPANSFYSMGLQVTPPSAATGTHIFHIEGTVGVENVGSVDIRVNASTLAIVKSDPFVIGGYHSPDIILYDLVTNIPLPIGGGPNGDTVMHPNKEYGFAARVHNASITSAINTVVRFWEFNGGVGSAGKQVDLQVAAIPPLTSIIVPSAHPFKSASSGHHKCAAISIYNALAGTCPDAVTASQVPDPLTNINHSCSAWRNTDAQIVFIHKPWEINLEVNALHVPDPGPIDIKVITYHVPLNWRTSENINPIANLLEYEVQREIPLYLHPVLHDKLNEIDLKTVIKPGARIELSKNSSATLHISGIIPENVQPGEKILVHVIASYPKTRESAAREVEFTQILHVEKS